VDFLRRPLVSGVQLTASEQNITSQQTELKRKGKFEFFSLTLQYVGSIFDRKTI
jgi:hypothetical protein